MSENLSTKELYELNHQKKKETRLQKPSNKGSNKLLIGIIVLLLVVFGGYKLWQTLSSPSFAKSSEQILSVQPTDWVKGNASASATLVEFSDFQCPACKYYYPTVKELSDTYGDKVKVVFRHFPLAQIHKNAFSAAKVSEAAGKQGKFWEMHDLLYENQDEWVNKGNPTDAFLSYAEKLGLNVDQFKKDLNSSDVSKRVKEDMAEANGLNVQGTPSFFLNGKKIANPRTLDDFKRIVDENSLK